MPKVLEVTNAHPEQLNLLFFCPACQCYHGIRTKEHSPQYGWDWNGDAESPTFSPSVLTTHSYSEANPKGIICHSFVKAGQIEYLADCTHNMAGQTVPLENV